MSADDTLQLANAPIIEAVLDIDCDLPIGIDLGAMEAHVREAFTDEYPKFRRQMVQKQQFEASPESAPEFSVQTTIQAFQFLKDDERQLVQVRSDGFSFNRLAPYASLDDYLPEIEWTWQRFRELMSPVLIRRIALRFINRLMLPTVDGLVDLSEYFCVGPQLADQESLQLLGFFDQHSAREVGTGHLVNTTMVMLPFESDRFPVIFDIEAMHLAPVEPEAWENIRGTILSLRRLKNNVFRRTLTEQCLNLFR